MPSSAWSARVAGPMDPWEESAGRSERSAERASCTTPRTVLRSSPPGGPASELRFLPAQMPARDSTPCPTPCPPCSTTVASARGWTARLWLGGLAQRASSADDAPPRGTGPLGGIGVTSVDLVVDSFRRTPHGAGHSERTRQELRAALAEADLLDGLSGLRIRELDEDEVLTRRPGRRRGSDLAAGLPVPAADEPRGVRRSRNATCRSSC